MPRILQKSCISELWRNQRVDRKHLDILRFFTFLFADHFRPGQLAFCMVLDKELEETFREFDAGIFFSTRMGVGVHLDVLAVLHADDGQGCIALGLVQLDKEVRSTTRHQIYRRILSSPQSDSVGSRLQCDKEQALQVARHHH